MTMKHNKIAQRGGLVLAPTRCEAHADHRILMVEDGISIRDINAGVLVISGYVVEGARH